MVEQFDAVDIIRTKRDRKTLSPEQIDWVIDAYTRGVVADEQMSALAMAIFLHGLDRKELVRWTHAMLNSGIRMDFSTLNRPTTDKHSTGGVGDKTTLPLAPLVASYGVAVPQLSGRGLGHTGGTLDKLESIPGWHADISADRMREILNDIGCVVCAAGAGLAPADKKLYALRDITATVDCIPLIASSIMSKKLAEGTSTLVLDVKVGSGAFMHDLENARTLAQTMVDIGEESGVSMAALLTDMDKPLGRTIGNSLEVEEAVEVLNGGGPADLVELTCELARAMLAPLGISDPDVEERLKDGRAMDMWRKMIRAQGGNPDAALPTARHSKDIRAPHSGVMTRMDALSWGVASWRLGAGRATKDDTISAGAGIRLHATVGEEVREGDVIATLYADDEQRFARAEESLEGSLTIEENGTYSAHSIVLDRINA